MTAIGIRYLTGYAAANDLAADAPEWPPHPGRVFMALAAAHFETRGGTEERAALEWLEEQAAPEIRASDSEARSSIEVYVPVNDQTGGVTRRSRQPRSFRKTRPACDTVYLMWSAVTPEGLTAHLRELCLKVTRIGYSASLTQVWLEEKDVPAANWVPDETFSTHRMRVPVAGTLRNLERSYNQAGRERYLELEAAIAAAPKSGQAKLRNVMKAEFPAGPPEPVRPKLNVWRGYRMVEEESKFAETDRGPFDEAILLLSVEEGCALGLESTQQLTGAIRNAAMKAAGENPPEWLSGHAADGSPSRQPHAAFFPLPYVGATHADGHVMGLGIAVPAWLTASAGGRRELRERLGRLLFLEDGEAKAVRLWSQAERWEWTLARETRERPPVALRRERWTQTSQTWASVTPVVLHHYPKRRAGSAEEIVTAALETAGYPEAAEIRISAVSAVAGAPTAAEMPQYEQGGADLCRYQVHAVIRFRRPVAGPVLVGRGRYRGYGLFVPHAEEGKG
jgi:CRISPR-associated protein Csb2